ncbi:hypothetical protein ACJJTC_002105 [Scirpophaga incertulas]
MWHRKRLRPKDIFVTYFILILGASVALRSRRWFTNQMIWGTWVDAAQCCQLQTTKKQQLALKKNSRNQKHRPAGLKAGSRGREYDDSFGTFHFADLNVMAPDYGGNVAGGTAPSPSSGGYLLRAIFAHSLVISFNGCVFLVDDFLGLS